MITLRQVEAFYWVGVLGSFAATAEKLHVAQSTVSKRIQEMEMLLGIELFDRETRSGRLTMKGSELLPLAEKILRFRSRFIEAAKNPEAISGTLRLGITELIAVTWLPDLIASIKAKYPLLALEPVVDLVVDLYKRLEERSVDFVIGPRIYKDDRFTSTLLGRVEQAWMSKPGIFPEGEIIPLKELRRTTLLLQSQGSGLLFVINRLFDENGVRPSAVISCNGMIALSEMAAAGLGVTCLPRPYFEPDIAAGRLQVIKTDPPVPPLLYAVAARRDSVGNLGMSFSSMVVDACNFNARVRPTLQFA